MTALELALQNWPAWVLWGLVASTGMATLMEGAQLAGASRMSLPFLFGTFLTGDRRRAIVVGYVAYLLGGWAFALLYALMLGSFAGLGLWALTGIGFLAGLGHGAFLVTVFLTVLPLVHPRLASDYDTMQDLGRIEPPGAFGLNYGRATPVVTLGAQAVYGAVMGLGYGAAIAS
ncbi:hypothetical protein [Palleronia rufa]|uniref:hypothetical protein n=1 Tax=Palleronia rufa TaxID=1530186 RepID=UPI00056D8F1B|nr:hypothetical protein [Palleronia rufa]